MRSVAHHGARPIARRKPSRSSGEIMIAFPPPYSIRSRSRDSAGLDSADRVRVTLVMLEVAIFHLSGPLWIRSSGPSTRYCVESNIQRGKPAPTTPMQAAPRRPRPLTRVAKMYAPSSAAAAAMHIKPASQTSIFEGKFTLTSNPQVNETVTLPTGRLFRSNYWRSCDEATRARSGTQIRETNSAAKRSRRPRVSRCAQACRRNGVGRFPSARARQFQCEFSRLTA